MGRPFSPRRGTRGARFTIISEPAPDLKPSPPSPPRTHSTGRGRKRREIRLICFMQAPRAPRATEFGRGWGEGCRNRGNIQKACSIGRIFDKCLAIHLLSARLLHRCRRSLIGLHFAIGNYSFWLNLETTYAPFVSLRT